MESPSLEEKLDELKAFKHWTDRAQYIVANYQKIMEHSAEVKQTFVSLPDESYPSSI